MSTAKPSEEKEGIQTYIDEKRPVSELSYDIEDGDEALELVGTLRSAHFSEEYNLRLRRKLVYGSRHHTSEHN